MMTMTASSTSDWRGWWREESIRTGTDWPTLAWQHVGALSVVRTFCSSGASS